MIYFQLNKIGVLKQLNTTEFWEYCKGFLSSPLPRNKLFLGVYLLVIIFVLSNSFKRKHEGCVFVGKLCRGRRLDFHMWHNPKIHNSMTLFLKEEGPNLLGVQSYLVVKQAQDGCSLLSDNAVGQQIATHFWKTEYKYWSIITMRKGEIWSKLFQPDSIIYDILLFSKNSQSCL